MKIFVAGATGVLGLRLLPLLLDAGHEVTGMTRSAGKAKLLADLGVTPVVCDVFDIDTLCQSMSASRPAVVVHQLTDLPDDPARIAEFAAGHTSTGRQPEPPLHWTHRAE